MHYLRDIRRRIERLGPYPSLFLLVVPLAVVEPLKLVTLYVADKGHWKIGLCALLCAYAISLLLTHGLFKVVKPKLLTLPWFATIWTWFAATRDKALSACVSSGR
jgi:hypothetical protein